MIKRLALATTLTLFGATTAHAEFFGMPNGRSADPGGLPQISVEGSFTTGDAYQHIGARVNYQASPQLTVFGDVGQSEFGEGVFEASGLSFGAGVFFFLADQQVAPQFDIALKGSFHLANLENDGVQDVFGFDAGDSDINNISLETLLSSPEPFTAGGMKWYANAGVNILGGDGDDTEILLGGGITLPVGPGEAYAGADLIDSIQFGAGYRYFIQ